MKRIALKIDADTYRGTLVGVPALAALLKQHAAQATFFFSLGRDRSGCESYAGSLARYYGLATRLYGRLLPAPNIGARCAEVLRQIEGDGFEVGIHAWDRVRWEKEIAKADNAWVEEQMAQACARFTEIFATRPPRTLPPAGG